jgi:hypothetical protein
MSHSLPRGSARGQCPDDRPVAARRGRVQQSYLSPLDRAPCGLSVTPGSPPRGCGTARRIVTSCATEGYAGRAARTSRRLSMLPLRWTPGNVSKWPKAEAMATHGCRFLRSTCRASWRPVLKGRSRFSNVRARPPPRGCGPCEPSRTQARRFVTTCSKNPNGNNVRPKTALTKSR